MWMVTHNLYTKIKHIQNCFVCHGFYPGIWSGIIYLIRLCELKNYIWILNVQKLLTLVAFRLFAVCCDLFMTGLIWNERKLYCLYLTLDGSNKRKQCLSFIIIHLKKYFLLSTPKKLFSFSLQKRNNRFKCMIVIEFD